MTLDPLAHGFAQVQRLEDVDDPQRVLEVPKARVPGEPLAQREVERLLADVPERRMAEVVPQPDGLDEVLVSPSARATVRDTCVTSSVCVSRVR